MPFIQALPPLYSGIIANYLGIAPMNYFSVMAEYSGVATLHSNVATLHSNVAFILFHYII
jgi:hypothetical protein